MLFLSPTFNYREEGMGFKKIKKEFSFADVVLESSKKNNRSIKKMQKLKKSIDWRMVWVSKK